MDSHCLNSGKCVTPATSSVSDDEQQSQPQQPQFKYCQCQEGYSGPRCSRYCPYDCQNGGICRTGKAATSQASPTSIQGDSTKNNQNGDYYCKCHGHYTGLLCEISYVNCGKEEGTRCYNGGQCVIDDRNDLTTGDHYCNCPKGYEGPSCEEYVMTTGEKSTFNNDKNMTEEGKTAITVMLILMVFLVTTLFILLRRKRRSARLPPKFIIFEDYHPSEGDNDQQHETYRDEFHDDHLSSGRAMMNVI